MGLSRAIQLAQRVREAAGHGEDASGSVLEHDRGALNRRPQAQLRPGGGLLGALDHTNVDHVIELQGATDAGAPGREREDTAVREADTDDLRSALLVLALLDDHGRRPVDVVKRQMSALQRLPPGGLVTSAARTELPDRLREVLLRAGELVPARVEFVPGEALLQSRLGRLLQGRVQR
jgi:hypothetical protein